MQEKLFQTISDGLFQWASKTNEIYEPQWNVRIEVAKNLLTISSAAVVLSMTLLSKNDPIANAYSPWILRCCWAAFLISILSSIATLWLSMGLYHLSSSVVDLRKDLRQRLDETDSISLAEAGKIVEDITREPLEKIGWRDRWASMIMKIGLGAFLLAFATLAVVGWRRLL